MTPPDSTTIQPLCELRAATVAATRAPSVALLEGVNWKVMEGDRWVVVSSAGAGKTALLLTAAGIQRPLEGEIRLFGQCLAGLRENELLPLRKQVGLVFEGGGRLFPELTVAQNIALPFAYHHSVAWEDAIVQIMPLLEWMELGPYAKEHPKNLIRGLWPRVGLARALALSPRLLLLDHPWRGADFQERHWWRSKLAEISQYAPSVAAWVLTGDEPGPWLSLATHLGAVHQRQFNSFENFDAGRRWLAEHHLLASDAERR